MTVSSKAVLAARNFVDTCCQHAAFVAGRGLIENEITQLASSKPPMSCKQIKASQANGTTQGRKLISKKKAELPWAGFEPRSLAYMTSALTTKPPRQLSGRGTNPGIIKAMQLSLINRWALTQYVGSNRGNETTKDAAIQTKCIHVNKSKQAKQMELLKAES